jgi:cytochrome c peroxidase
MDYFFKVSFVGGNAVYFFQRCSPRQPSIAGGCRKSLVAVPAALFVMHLSLTVSAVRAQTALNPPLPDLTGIVKSQEWALALGKAFFWDQRVGSDGNACASCHFHAGADTRLTNQISPGFKDITKKHLEDGEEVEGDVEFGSERSDLDPSDPLYVASGQMPSGPLAGANYTLTPGDMPLHQLLDETDRNSPIISTTNDRVSSQGAFDADFNTIRGPKWRKHFIQMRRKDSSGKEICDKAIGDIFHTKRGYPARQVEPRNTPTTINAVFNHRNFWDDRANNLFNGVGVFGMRDILGDPDARLIVLNGKEVSLDYLKLENASLASQAVGPPISQLEMSCEDRTFADIARKLMILGNRPLEFQKIHPYDSILGPYAHPSGRGLHAKYNYKALIQKAFDEKYWSAKGLYQIRDGKLEKDYSGYTQMEINFPMFWGISIMLYESTLVSDQSEADSLLASGRLVMTPSFAPAGPGIGTCTSLTGDVDELLVRGCKIFARAAGGGPGVTPLPADGIRGGNCFICHNAPGGGVGRPIPPLLSQATLQAGETFALMIQVGKNLGGVHRHDQGTMSIGLRPVFTDLINGGTDPYGNPLSFTRQYHNYLTSNNDPALRDPSFLLDPPLQRAVAAGTIGNFAGTIATLGVDGAAKAPILRNVALTPPYFSWGGYPNLCQALKLYNRGSNRRDITAANASVERAAGTFCTSGDNSGTGPDGNQPYPLVGVTNCDTNTTATILSLGLLDCDPEPNNGNQPPVACAAQGKTAANDDLAALERFLKSLTDYRVQCDQAPFDHPSLHIVDGHKDRDWNHNGRADDIVFELPEVGAYGYYPESGFCIPNAGDLFAPGMQARSGGKRVPLQ